MELGSMTTENTFQYNEGYTQQTYSPHHPKWKNNLKHSPLKSGSIALISRNKPNHGNERHMQWKLIISEERDWERWKISLWIGGIGSAEITTLPKGIYRFNTIPIKILKIFFTETEIYSEIYIGSWKTKDSQRNTEQNNAFGGIIITYFKP